jgi:hypothetical protein
MQSGGNWMKRLGALTYWLGGSLLLATGLTAPSVEACSLRSPPQAFQPTASDDKTPPTLDEAHISIRRAKDPGSSGNSDCSDVGGYTVTLRASDDQTPSVNLAVALELVKGNLPFSLPDGAVLEEASFRREGEISFSFGDDGGSYDAVVAVRVMDGSGNLSEPIEVHVSGEDVGGCAFSRRPARGSAAAALALTLALLVRRRQK